MKPLVTTIVIAVLALAPTLFAQEEQTTDPTTSATPAPAQELPVLQALDGADLDAHTGQMVIVEGVIQNVGTSKNTGMKFLNFGDRKTDFIAVVFSKDLGNFPDGVDQFAQQKVRVRGKLTKHRDQNQIVLKSPDQIKPVTE